MAAAPRPPTTIGLLVGLLSAVVLVTTAWTASGLLPASSLQGRVAAYWLGGDDALWHAPPQYVSEDFLLRQLVRAYLQAPWVLRDAGVAKAPTKRPPPAAGWPFGVGGDPSEGEEDEGDAAPKLVASATAALLTRDPNADELYPAQPAAAADDAGADIDDGSGAADVEEAPAVPVEVAASGDVVAIRYSGPTSDADGDGAGPRALYLKLCNVDWLCASGWHARAPAARFERLPLGGSNATWFALRSVSNGRLVEVVPPEDDEGWVVRARGGASGAVSARARELFRMEAGGLRNWGTRALLNFRGIDAHDGVSIRGHGDTTPRRACTRPSPRTRFAVVPAPPPRNRGGAGGTTCVALGVATRARSAKATAASLPLFDILLPSLLATIDADDPAYRYQVHVGFDDDDPFWSRPTKLASARALGAEKTAGLPVTLNFTTYSGMKGAPCHVWSALQQQACASGCEYFFQLNDDIELVTPGWADEFVGALQENSYLRNFGITGPRDTNNARLMTQSFAHCTHLRIFGWYYPPAFANWYSDDWATQVYGTKNTFWRRDVEVAHKLVRQGPRYAVSYEDKAHLQSEIDAGRARIAAYLAAHHPELPSFAATQIDAAADAVRIPPD